MGIDDEMQVLLDQLGLEGQIAPTNEAIKALIASLPYLGGPLSSLCAGQARRRLVDRLKILLTEMKCRLDNLEAAAVDKAFFESEEFQTLFALAVDQLYTAHDRRKIEMLASALANSGTKAYVSNGRKEIFTRVLRDLSVPQLLALKRIGGIIERIYRSGRGPVKNEVCNPAAEDLLLYRTLEKYGLVEEFVQQEDMPSLISGGTHLEELRGSIDELKRIVLGETVNRCFRTTEMGEDFLGFVSDRGAGTG